MALASVLIVISLIILYFGAEWIVSGGSSLAARLGVSPLIIGLTIVSIGTSAPELVVSIKSSIEGQGALSMGNVIGSNVFNICLILGLSAVIYPLSVKRQLLKLDVPVMIASSLLFLFLFWDGNLTTTGGIILLSSFILYMVYLFIYTLRHSSDIEEENVDDELKMFKHWGIDAILIILGILGLTYGADLLVDNSIFIAQQFGMSEAMIGLTIVAAGTSIPEMATSVVASLKKRSDIAIGNVVGSNIFNTLLILGTAASINPIKTPDINLFDSIFLIVISILLLLFMKTGRRIVRMEGIIFLLLYLIYFGYKFATTII